MDDFGIFLRGLRVVKMSLLEVLFQKRVSGFHQVSKRKKTFARGRPSGLMFLRVWRLEMKPEARDFEITSPTKKASLKSFE